MTIKRSENSSGSTGTSQQISSQDRYRRDARRRDTPSAKIYAHPRYVPQLRQMIKQKMDEFSQARSDALETIDQRIQELSRIKHELGPAVATDLMVTLAEARSILLSLNPTAHESKETLADMSDRLRSLVRQKESQAG